MKKSEIAMIIWLYALVIIGATTLVFKSYEVVYAVVFWLITCALVLIVTHVLK